MTIFSKLIRKIFRVKTCPLIKKCRFYNENSVFGEKPNLDYNISSDHNVRMCGYYCVGENFSDCARYYLHEFATCDCVDEHLKPNEMQKAKLIEKIEKSST